MKRIASLAALMLLMAFTVSTFTACSDDDDKEKVKVTAVTITDEGGNALSAVSIDEDGTYQINASIEPADATEKDLIYSSNNEEVAIVSATGLVTAVGPGTAVITVTSKDGSISATIEVTVEPKEVPATGIEFIDADGNVVSVITVEEGAPTGVTYRLLPENGVGGVTWVYSDERIAAYDRGVKGRWPGTATITAKLDDTDISATLTVHVKLAPANQSLTSEGESHHTVDLGLPSGTLWADGNMGYTGEYQEFEMGKWYYWGLTESPEDNIFTQDNYNSQVPADIAEDIAGTLHDPAAMLWGGDWRMPTTEQMQELLDECTWTIGTANDVYKGYWVTGPNGNKIFLPYTASCDYRGWVRPYNNHDWGCYWTSTPNGAGFADYLYFNQYSMHRINTPNYGPGVKYSGHSIRPVQNPAR
ncbi:MAG: Ig-like domain-containing protein [Bacteroidaceae bacterium]|nr:Ig-like domain-containing protein [Bacteroidaceae bacterium]